MSKREGDLTDPPDRGPMDQFSAHLDRGWDLIHRGDFEGAQRSAEKSLELDAESPEAYNLLGFVSAALGDHEGALEHYRHALSLDDSFVEAMLNAAEVLIHPLHDFDAAINLVDEALEWTEGADEVADALLLKFDAYMHQGDRELAKKVLRTLPEGEFETPRLDFLVGRGYFEVGEFEQAKLYLERARSREPEAPDIHYYVGLLFDAQGEHDNATVAFLRCRELDTAAPRPIWAGSAAQFERQARRAIERLEPTHRDALDGALVVVSDLPGAEVVADGVDPRAAVLLDALGDRDAAPRAGRAFVYQRNVERMCESGAKLEDELVRLLRTEIEATFPALASTETEADAETNSRER
jgi:tetratricopeptide (TPR) repeat protein